MVKTFKIQLPNEWRASAASSDIPAIYQNTFSNQLPSECRASVARSDIPAIYFFGFTKLSAAMLVVQGLIVELSVEESKSER